MTWNPKQKKTKKTRDTGNQKGREQNQAEETHRDWLGTGTHGFTEYGWEEDKDRKLKVTQHETFNIKEHIMPQTWQKIVPTFGQQCPVFVAVNAAGNSPASPPVHTGQRCWYRTVLMWQCHVWAMFTNSAERLRRREGERLCIVCSAPPIRAVHLIPFPISHGKW